MRYQILVATPDGDFGNLICATLEETGVYSVHITLSCRETLAFLETQAVDVAILDADLPEQPLADWVAAVHAAQPLMQIVLSPPYGLTDGSPFYKVNVNGRLLRPLTKTNLIKVIYEALSSIETDASVQTIDETAAPEAEIQEITHHDALPTFDEAATNILVEQVSKNQALAALWMQGMHTTAFAGSLTDTQQLELQDLLVEMWNWQDPADLAQFRRLKDGTECLLYVRATTNRRLLALVFDPTTPLSQAAVVSTTIIEALAPELPTLLSSTSAEVEELEDPFPYDEDASDEMELEPIDLAALMGGSPAPDPDQPPLGDTVSVVGGDLELPEFIFPWEQGIDAPEEQDPSPAAGQAEGDSAQASVKAPPSAYTVILIPRQAIHFLASDLAALLSRWAPQLCMAQGVRLYAITLRPQYMQLTLLVPTGTNLAPVLRALRLRLSEKVFNEFADLQSPDNLDFWADDELILPGLQPPSSQTILDFIRTVRSNLS